jgi:uncharacterized protein
MAKNTLKRYMPNPRKIRQIKSLQVLGDWVYQPNLWHINRQSASTAFFVGFFCAFIPLPTQMVFAALFSVILRCNLPLAVGLCWITNPITMPPIFYLAYKTGATVMGVTVEAIEFELSWNWISHSLILVWQPFLLGCLICGIFFGSVGYLVINTLWRWEAVRRWEARVKNRRAHLQKTIHDVKLRQEEILQRDAQDTTPPENTSTQ